MNYTVDQVEKALKCCALLPPPGDEEVRKLAEDCLELAALLRSAQDRIADLERRTADDVTEGHRLEIECPHCHSILSTDVDYVDVEGALELTAWVDGVVKKGLVK